MAGGCFGFPRHHDQISSPGHGRGYVNSVHRVHVPTHIMSGWCVANAVRLTARERVFCMAAASLADVDGLSRAFGPDAYMDYHHVLGHNVTFAVGITVIFTCLATPAHRTRVFLLCLALTHLHLVLDYFGSG